MGQDKETADWLRDGIAKDKERINDLTKGGQKISKNGVDITQEEIDRAQSRIDRLGPLADAFEKRDK